MWRTAGRVSLAILRENLSLRVAVAATPVHCLNVRLVRGLRAFVALAVLLSALAFGCSTPDDSTVSTPAGDTRVGASEEGGQPSAALPTGSNQRLTEGPISATELGLVYQLILQQHVEAVDHAALIEGAIRAVSETGQGAGLLPLDSR